MRPPLAFAYALVALVLVVACGDAGDEPVRVPATQSATLDWKELALETAAPSLTAEARARLTLVPTSTPLIPETDVRSCTAADLSAAFNGSNAMTQQPIFDFGIGNTSSTQCQLKEAPELRLLGSSGEELSTSVVAGDFWGGVYREAVLLLPGLGDIALHDPLKTGQARITLTYSTATCHGPTYTPEPRAFDIKLALPDDQGTVAIDMRGWSVGSCHNALSMAYQPVR